MSHEKELLSFDTSNLNVDLNEKQPEVQLLQHLSTTGCAVIKNHEVPIYLFEDVIDQWKQFFSCEEKYNWLRTDLTDEGFIPINAERARKDEVADFKELYQTHYQGKYPNSINIHSTQQLFNGLVKLGEKLIDLLDISLPSSIKNNMSMTLPEMVRGNNNHLIRIIHYPPIERGIKALRAAPHTDICLFTMILGGTVNGLELKDHNDVWYEPIANDASIVIFNSEMLELATNGYLKAVVHRVKTNPNSYTESRYSIPIGFHPRRQALLKKGLTAAEHLCIRLNEMGYNGNLLNLKDN
ncbi:MAG: isopenicillin N synthase family oxygenase [Coxiellaceae bacterium]|nr:MAG: isopenicillin N synthase family oxygenase [Coxiellaceae bacterium]